MEAQATPKDVLPFSRRRCAIQFTSENGDLGAVAYPINYEELYNLKGRLLTLIDATFPDDRQRKAQKDIVWQALQNWMADIQRTAGEGEDQIGGASAHDERTEELVP